jgi:hypothetical protein
MPCCEATGDDGVLFGSGDAAIGDSGVPLRSGVGALTADGRTGAWLRNGLFPDSLGEAPA